VKEKAGKDGVFLNIGNMGKFGQMVDRAEQIVTKQKSRLQKKDVCEACGSYGM
jgi:hypothetical protein